MPGYWPTDYWPNSASGAYWPTDYWPEYGTGAPPVADVLVSGYMPARFIPMLGAIFSGCGGE